MSKCATCYEDTQADSPEWTRYLSFALGITRDGDCIAIGRGSFGQLGMGDFADRVASLCPVTHIKPMKVSEVQCGAFHSAIYAHLPLEQQDRGEQNDRNDSTQVPESDALSYSSALPIPKLPDGGDLYTMGWNRHGQLGRQSEMSTIPNPIDMDEQGPSASDEIRSFRCGSRLTMVWKWNGSVWITRDGNEGSGFMEKVHLADDVTPVAVEVGQWATIIVAECTLNV